MTREAMTIKIETELREVIKVLSNIQGITQSDLVERVVLKEIQSDYVRAYVDEQLARKEVSLDNIINEFLSEVIVVKLKHELSEKFNSQESIKELVEYELKAFLHTHLKDEKLAGLTVMSKPELVRQVMVECRGALDRSNDKLLGVYLIGLIADENLSAKVDIGLFSKIQLLVDKLNAVLITEELHWLYTNYYRYLEFVETSDKSYLEVGNILSSIPYDFKTNSSNQELGKYIKGKLIKALSE